MTMTPDKYHLEETGYRMKYLEERYSQSLTSFSILTSSVDR